MDIDEHAVVSAVAVRLDATFLAEIGAFAQLHAQARAAVWQLACLVSGNNGITRKLR